MGIGRLLGACLMTLTLFVVVFGARPAVAQTNFDRPGGDYRARP